MEPHQRHQICEAIKRWNSNTMDMFAISWPDENMEFHGVIRFFLHEQQQQPAVGAAATKCIRVSSAHNVAHIVHALVAKFHADMRMLASATAYSLWEEVQGDYNNGEHAGHAAGGRCMDAEERPLLVQLSWCCGSIGDDEKGVMPHQQSRPSRFVLRRLDDACAVMTPAADFVRSIPRRFSKRRQTVITATTTTSPQALGSVKSLGGKRRTQLSQKANVHLYDVVPLTSSSSSPCQLSPPPFARTVSNPELILRRRREQKLDERLRHMSNGGGSLKIYGVELFPHRPYVTLLVDATDTAAQVVRATLDKYGMEEADSANFALAEVSLLESDAISRSFSDLRSIEKRRERLLHSLERPLQLLELHMTTANNMVFFLRRRPPSTPAEATASVLQQRSAVTSAGGSKSCALLDCLVPSLHHVNDGGGDDLVVVEQPSTTNQHYLPSANDHHHEGVAMITSSPSRTARKAAETVTLPTTNATAQQHAATSAMLLLPCLVPINAFASTANFGAGAVAIQPGVTEIGSSSACAIQLRAPSVLPRHCALRYCHRRQPSNACAALDDKVTSAAEGQQQQQSSSDDDEQELVENDEDSATAVVVSLLDKSALVEVDGASVHADVRLQNGVQLRIGGVYCYRFFTSNRTSNVVVDAHGGGECGGDVAAVGSSSTSAECEQDDDDNNGTMSMMSQMAIPKDYFPSSSSTSSGPFINSSTTAAAVTVNCTPQQHSEAVLIVQNIFSPPSPTSAAVPSFQQHNQQQQQQNYFSTNNNSFNIESTTNNYVELYKWSPAAHLLSSCSTCSSCTPPLPQQQQPSSLVAATTTTSKRSAVAGDCHQEENNNHQMVTLITAAAAAHYQHQQQDNNNHTKQTTTMSHHRHIIAKQLHHSNTTSNNNDTNINNDVLRQGRQPFAATAAAPSSYKLSSATAGSSPSTSTPPPCRPPHQQLPILIECMDQQSEVTLFQFELFAIVNNNNIDQRFGTFRLTPAFVLYAICRHRLSIEHHADNYDEERHHRLVSKTFAMFIDSCSRMLKANHQASRELLSFWLSNASELLNMGRADARLARAVGTALLHELACVVHRLFTLLVERCKQLLLAQGVQPVVQQWLLSALAATTAAPMSTNHHGEVVVPASAALVASLDECLRVVRWALLNPALTIQLFSQLFHFVSATVFNWLVTEPDARPLICLQFGLQLKQLLQHVQQWAEQQGLELAAECHMDRLCQTAQLLNTPKRMEHFAVLGATCYRLNSVQVHHLLENYVSDMHAGEASTVSRELIKHLVALARQQADQHQQQTVAKGQNTTIDVPPSSSPPQLFECTSLQLPFLLPHDGYVVEKLRGVPPDMVAFLNALQQRGLINVFVQQQRHTGASAESLAWNVHMKQHQQQQQYPSAANNQQQQQQSTTRRGGRSVSTTPSATSSPSAAAATASFPPTVAAGGITRFPPTPTPPPHQQHVCSNDEEASSAYAEIRRHSSGALQHRERQQQQQKNLPLPPPPPARCQSASIFGAGGATHNHHGHHLNNNQQHQPQPNECQQQQWNERLIDAGGAPQLRVQRITLCRTTSSNKNSGGGGGIGLSIVEVVRYCYNQTSIFIITMCELS